MLAMRALLSVLFVMPCSALLVAGAPAEPSDSDAAKTAIDAPAAPLSMDSRREEDTAAGRDEPNPQPENADPAGQGQNVVNGRTVVEQTSSLPAVDAGDAKLGEDSASASESQAGNGAAIETSGLSDSICWTLEAAAAANGLPLEFFARVIWEESRFKPNAIGPPTRAGHRAQGIAQFMPYTAAERGLADPFNPESALSEAAEFLAELRREFGNLGLAAAAYNAGPGRVRDFIDGRGGMPAQTRHYVRAITGRSVEEWAALGRETRKKGIAKSTSCGLLTAVLKEPPALVIGPVERKVREAAIKPSEILDGRQKPSVGQSVKGRLAAGPIQVRKTPLRTSASAARLNTRRSAASSDSGAPARPSANSMRLTAATTGSSSKLASRIASPKSIAQENSIARGALPRRSTAAQSRKPKVHIASLSGGKAARLTKTNLSVTSVGSRRSSEAPSKSRGRALDSKQSRIVPLNGLAPEEKATKRVAALPGASARTTTDRPAGQVEKKAARAPSSRLSATRAKTGKSSAQPSTSAVPKRSESRPAAKRMRSAVRDEVVITSEDRLKKIMQICRGC